MIQSTKPHRNDNVAEVLRGRHPKYTERRPILPTPEIRVPFKEVSIQPSPDPIQESQIPEQNLKASLYIQHLCIITQQLVCRAPVTFIDGRCGSTTR